MPRLLSAVHRYRCRIALPRGAGPVSGVPGFRLGPSHLGIAPNPGRRGLLFQQLRAVAPRGVLPRPGRGVRIGARPRRLEYHQRGRPAGEPADRRRGSTAGPGPRNRRRRRIRAAAKLSRPDRRLLRVRRSPACAVQGFRRALANRSLPARLLYPDRGPRPGDAAMTGQVEVTYTVLDVAPEPYAVSPLLTARVGIVADGDDPVHAIALRCQVRIEPPRRSYSDTEAAGLSDLFGPRERWASTQHSFLWQHCTAMVPGFAGTTTVALPLDCTYDFEVAGAKYLHALRDGTVPLQFLFSGTIFVKSERGFSVQQVPWDCEYRYDMPVAVWRELIAAHYPNAGWVRLSHETIAALAGYKSEHGMLDLEDAVTSLLVANRETAR